MSATAPYELDTSLEHDMFAEMRFDEFNGVTLSNWTTYLREQLEQDLQTDFDPETLKALSLDTYNKYMKAMQFVFQENAQELPPETPAPTDSKRGPKGSASGGGPAKKAKAAAKKANAAAVFPVESRDALTMARLLEDDDSNLSHNVPHSAKVLSTLLQDILTMFAHAAKATTSPFKMQDYASLQPVEGHHDKKFQQRFEALLVRPEAYETIIDALLGIIPPLFSHSITGGTGAQQQNHSIGPAVTKIVQAITGKEHLTEKYKHAPIFLTKNDVLKTIVTGAGFQYPFAGAKILCPHEQLSLEAETELAGGFNLHVLGCSDTVGYAKFSYVDWIKASVGTPATDNLLENT